MATTPQAAPLNPSPKTRFHLSADNLKKHRDLVDSNEFQRGADFALLQYQAQLSLQPVEMAGAAANHFKMTGALEFLQAFRLLAEVAPRASVVDNDNLKQP